MADIANPHDKFFKEVLSRQEVARDFIGCFKPGAPRPVSTATIKALMCFCLSPPLAGKSKPPAMRAVVDSSLSAFGYSWPF